MIVFTTINNEPMYILIFDILIFIYTAGGGGGI